MATRPDHVARSGHFEPAAISTHSVADALSDSGGPSNTALDFPRRDLSTRLRRSNALLHALSADSGDLALLVDAELKICCVNRGVAGLSVKQMRGKRVSTILPESARATVASSLRRVFDTTESCTFETALAGREVDTTKSASAVRYFACFAALTHDDDIGAAIIITMRDVTERKRLQAEIVAVSNRERETIGRDLHDALGQELTGIALLLRGLAMRSEGPSPEIARDVNEMIGLVNHAHLTVRSLVRGIVPEAVASGRLESALLELTRHCTAQYGLPVEFHSEADADLKLSDGQSVHLYRIAQEALTNTARHGRAGSARVSLRVAREHFVLEITDNGTGIAAERQQGSGMGMSIMRYRTSLIGAMFEIVSREGSGTTIRVTGNHQVPIIGREFIPGT